MGNQLSSAPTAQGYENGVELGSSSSFGEHAPIKLQRRLRNVLVQKGKMEKGEVQWMKQTIWNYSHRLLEWCKKGAEPVDHFEYTGNIYECLEVKNCAKGQCVIMAVLKMKKDHIEEEEIVPDLLYRIRESSFENPRFPDFQAGASTFFSTEKMSLWLEELIQAWINSGNAGQGVKMNCQQCGVYVQLDIRDRVRGGTVSIDFLPCFEVRDEGGDAHHFVAKSYNDYTDSSPPSSLPNSGTLWRHSFAVKERELLQDMDPRKKGCRHDCARLLTVLFSSDRTLRKLSSYHLKTAFLHFQHTETNWKAEQLASRFLGLLMYIYQCVKKRELLHYYTQRNNLLNDYKDITLQNVERRLLEITSNEKKLLACL